MLCEVWDEADLPAAAVGYIVGVDVRENSPEPRLIGGLLRPRCTALQGVAVVSWCQIAG